MTLALYLTHTRSPMNVERETFLTVGDSMNRSRTIPKSALMTAYEEGYLSAQQDLQRSYDAGHTDGYLLAWDQWSDFVESLPDPLYAQMLAFIVTTARDMFQADEPPF